MTPEEKDKKLNTDKEQKAEGIRLLRLLQEGLVNDIAEQKLEKIAERRNRLDLKPAKPAKYFKKYPRTITTVNGVQI